MTNGKPLNPVEDFRNRVAENIRNAGNDRAFINLSNVWNQAAIRHGYFQNFTWLRRPLIQSPQDLYATRNLSGVAVPI